MDWGRRSKRYHSTNIETSPFLMLHLNSVALKAHDTVLTLALSYRWAELAVTLKLLVLLISTSNHSSSYYSSPHLLYQPPISNFFNWLPIQKQEEIWIQQAEIGQSSGGNERPRGGNTEVATTTCQEQCPIIFSVMVVIYPAAWRRSVQRHDDDDQLRERERERRQRTKRWRIRRVRCLKSTTKKDRERKPFWDNKSLF